MLKLSRSMMRRRRIYENVIRSSSSEGLIVVECPVVKIIAESSASDS